MKNIYHRVISLFLITLILTGCFKPESPQDVTQVFWEAVITQNVDDVIEYSTLLDAKSFDSFKKNWKGYQLVIGKIMIDGNQAEVETQLSRITDTDENEQRLTTYLVKQDGQWKVDYVRTAKSINGHSFSHFLGQLDELGKKLSDTLKDSSEKFNVEMQRLERELKNLAQSSGDEAKNIIKQYGRELKQNLKELADSIDRALKEHKDDLSEDDKRVLLNISIDLNNSQNNLAQPTVNTINQSNQKIRQAHQQLDKIDNKKISNYKKQWHDWQYRFEQELQSLLEELSEK